MRLLPREEKFYALFMVQVGILNRASALLLEGVRNGNSRLHEAAAEIELLEHKGDEVIHDVFTRLNQTFITPFDPEDIHGLASRLDDVLDGLEETAHRLVAYKIDPIPAPMVEVCRLIDECTKAMRPAIEALEKNAPLLEPCIEINRLENDGDVVGRKAVADLFETETNPITLIKLKECYDMLEATIDSCEDVADALQNIVVKNS